MDLWDMLRDAQAAQAELLAEQQRVIDSLPRSVRVWPPGCCACFEGHCRGGDVVNGRLANGLTCKEAHRGSTPRDPPHRQQSTADAGVLRQPR